MSMPPSGVTGVMDEDALIEAEIAQELEQLDLENDDYNNEDDNEHQYENFQDDQLEKDNIPPELDGYLQYLQQQRSQFEKELEECDEVLHYTSNSTGNSQALVPLEDVQLLERAAQEAGEDPKLFRRRILEEIENERDNELLDGDINEDIFLKAGIGNGQVGEADEKALVLLDQNQLEFQKMLKEKMAYIENVHKEREQKLKIELEEEKVAERKFHQQEEEDRRKRRLLVEQEVMTLAKERLIQQETLEQEEKQKIEENEKEMKRYEDEIQQLAEEVEKEKKQLEETMKQEEHKQIEKQERAATKIQSIYRGHSVRKVYKKVLNEKIEERRKLIVAEKVKEAEVKIEQRRKEIEAEKEAERKELEEKEREKKQQEEEKRLEEERIQKEEKMRRRIQEEKEKEEKRKQEQIRLEKERKKKEEEERKAEQKKVKEQERLKEELRLEEERKRKEEEERKKKEQMRLEEERRKKEEERKMQDQIRLEEERKKKEDEERKAEQKRNEEQTRQAQIHSGKIDQQDSKEEEEKALFSNKEIDMKRIEKVEETEHEETWREGSPEELKKEKKLAVENKAVRSQNYEEDENENNSLYAGNKPFKSGKGHEMGVASGVVSDIDEITEQDSKRKSTTTLNAMMHGLTDNLEKQRIEWIKQCVPWSKISNEPWKLKTDTTGKRAPRRPSSAKKLLPLEDHVITSAAHVQTLRQVTTVQLEDLPGCSVTTLGQCWGLESLSMKKCNLITVEGLLECKKLKYLDFQDNYIEYLDLKGLGSLIYLNLSHNKLSSVHGVDGCINLRWLNMSHNKVTRIGGMNTLRRLHTLDLSHNQLISTQGLSDTPTLQSVNLSHNHLQGCEDLTKLCLLQHLNLSSNNLLTLTDLQNQVLLQDLCVEDNSITDITTLKQMWLPLLQTLNLGQNSLEDLIAINHLHLLKTVDVSNNQIIDVDVVLNSLGDCFYLETVNIDGNPITEESSQIIDKFREKFSRLLSLDNTALKEHKETPIKPRNSYEAMCFTQIQLVQEINKQFEEDLLSLREKLPLDLDKISKTFFNFCDKTYQVAVDFRYAHEYGEITMAMPVAPSTPKSGNRPRSARSKPSQKEDQYMSPKDLFEKVIQTGKGGVSDKNFTGVQASRPTLTGKVVGEHLETAPKSEAYQLLRERSAIKIQAAWRGYSIRRDRRYEVRQPDLDIDLKVIEELHQAAIKIQAVWRGYNLRCKLERALEFARFDDEDDFEFDEVDLGEFNFDEDMLNDWKPPETPQVPSSHPVIGKPPSGKVNNLPPMEKVPGLKLDGPYPPSQPRKAWRGSDSPLSDVITPHNRPRPPSSLASGPLSVLDSHRSGMSKKEEKLSEEWGFKDSQTANLMIQRAKKMKYNSERRKKLSKLDPKQRLALFRKLEETTNVRTVKPPPRTTLPRKEYFQARQQEIEMKEFEKRKEQSHRKNRTFEWIHTQVGEYETTDSCINQQRKTMYGSEGNLPKLDSEVTAGRPVRLMGSPVSMDVQSVDSVSVTGEFSRPRRMSAGSNGSVILPAIKTGSAPSTRTKEKMSWRNPVQRSIGWGGGKKRQK